MIGHISEAHLNPAITLAAFIFNRISLLKVFIYFAAEMIGAILGYGALLVSSIHCPKFRSCKFEFSKINFVMVFHFFFWHSISYLKVPLYLYYCCLTQ